MKEIRGLEYESKKGNVGTQEQDIPDKQGKQRVEGVPLSEDPKAMSPSIALGKREKPRLRKREKATKMKNKKKRLKYKQYC